MWAGFLTRLSRHGAGGWAYRRRHRHRSLPLSPLVNSRFSLSPNPAKSPRPERGTSSGIAPPRSSSTAPRLPQYPARGYRPADVTVREAGFRTSEMRPSSERHDGVQRAPHSCRGALRHLACRSQTLTGRHPNPRRWTGRSNVWRCAHGVGTPRRATHPRPALASSPRRIASSGGTGIRPVPETVWGTDVTCIISIV